MPPNYYNDLSARWTIDGKMLKHMQSFNILYDQDGEGRYFQIYTPAIMACSLRSLSAITTLATAKPTRPYASRPSRGTSSRKSVREF